MLPSSHRKATTKDTALVKNKKIRSLFAMQSTVSAIHISKNIVYNCLSTNNNTVNMLNIWRKSIILNILTFPADLFIIFT